MEGLDGFAFVSHQEEKIAFSNRVDVEDERTGDISQRKGGFRWLRGGLLFQLKIPKIVGDFLLVSNDDFDLASNEGSLKKMAKYDPL